MIFPYSEPLDCGDGRKLESSLIIEQLAPLITEERKNRIEQVVAARTYSLAVVLEGIYDRGNASAVMRSAEAMGFARIHMIENTEKFKAANRVTQGADKWLDVTRWKSTRAAVAAIKSQGYRLCVTSLEASKPLDEIDFSEPTALVLGNEKEGVSQEMLEAADERVRIPMQGFVQSYNISVAGALCLYHVLQDRKRRLGRNGDLSAEQQQLLKASYYLRSNKSPKVLRKATKEARDVES